MKILLIVSALFTCYCCEAQKLNLQQVFDYLNSAEFRKACKDSIVDSWPKKRKRFKTDTTFLKANVCFIPYRYYLVKRKDTSTYWRDKHSIFDTFPSGRYYPPTETCNRFLYFTVTVLGTGDIIIEYLHKQDFLGWPIVFSSAEQFILTLSEDNFIKFKKYHYVFYD